MATIYVSYRNNEQPFVEAVILRLEQDHDVRIDYKIPPGADWRSHQQEELRRCDVFLVFVSVHRELSWPRRTDLQGRQKLYELVEYASKRTFADDSPRQDLTASFTAKRARLGSHQGRLLDYVTSHQGGRPYIPYEEVKTEFDSLRTTVYYRLEHLRLLGFLSRQIGDRGGEPLWGWSLSDSYRREVGL